jgi:hypothetical protein
MLSSRCWPTFQRCVPPSSSGRWVMIALMMEAVCISETSVKIYLTTRQYIPEESKLHTRPVRTRNLTFSNFVVCNSSVAPGNIVYMRFQVLTAASMMFRAVFWVIHGSITQKTALNNIVYNLSMVVGMFCADNLCHKCHECCKWFCGCMYGVMLRGMYGVSTTTKHYEFEWTMYTTQEWCKTWTAGRSVNENLSLYTVAIIVSCSSDAVVQPAYQYGLLEVKIV